MSHKINEERLKIELENCGWSFNSDFKCWIPNWRTAHSTVQALEQYQVACLAALECSHESTLDKPDTFLAPSEPEVADGQVGSSEGAEKGSEALTTGHYAPRRGECGGFLTVREPLPNDNTSEAQEDVYGSKGQDLSRAEG